MGQGLVFDKVKHLNSWTQYKKIFIRTTGSISTKLGTKHPWMKGIEIYSNKWSQPFQWEMIKKEQRKCVYPSLDQYQTWCRG